LTASGLELRVAGGSALGGGGEAVVHARVRQVVGCAIKQKD